MEPLTIRIREETKESLDTEADEYNVSTSEYVRELIQKGREYDELHDRLESREERIATLEERLAEQRNIESKIEDLPDKIRDSESYSERRQRLLDNATIGQRIVWRVTGVPVQELEDNDD